jgi:hypothetical protein
VHTTNRKKKGQGNVKNGNKYLAWAFVEAANFARRICLDTGFKRLRPGFGPRLRFRPSGPKAL